MTQLKLNKMTVACGLALGAFGFANVASAATIDLFVSGATAQDPNLEKVIVDLCDEALPLATRTKWTSAAGSTWNCQARSGLGSITAGTILNISKRTAGGSGEGIVQVVSGTLVRPGTTGCGPSVLRDLDPTVGVSNFQFFSGCTDAGAQSPHAGLSDVEPRLFGVNSGLASAGTIAGVFGVAMTDKLYCQLQNIQFPGACDLNDPARVPTLKSSELRGIMTNNLTDWTGVHPSIVAEGSGTTAIKVCRRGTTSGSQKTFEVRMLGLGCAGATALNSGAFNSTVNNLNDDSTLNNTLGSTVIGTATASGNGGFRGYTGVYTAVINNGSGDVDMCLTAADNQNELAIGFLGVERISGAAGTAGPLSDGDDGDGLVDKWHYAKLDGVYPSVANLVNGSYDNLWSQATFNRRPSGYTTDQTNLMNSLQTRIGDPANITGVPFLGIAGLPSNGYTWDGIAPVVRGERRTASGDINNCQDSLVVF
jgi:hypothetical protein